MVKSLGKKLTVLYYVESQKCGREGDEVIQIVLLLQISLKWNIQKYVWGNIISKNENRMSK